jgi:hypothetical protein
VSHTFAPVLVAQGTLVVPKIANRIFYAGATLPEFKVELGGMVAALAFALLGPLLAFGPQLAEAKRVGLEKYDMLAHRYAREFNEKWLRGPGPADEPLMGSADVQSLADLGNSFEVVKGMRFVPFTLATVIQLALAALAPVAPLTLTMISLEQLVERLIKVIF